MDLRILLVSIFTAMSLGLRIYPIGSYQVNSIELFSSDSITKSMDLFKFGDVTGDGEEDILIGWKVGAIWNKLEIYSLENGKFKKIVSEDYSKIEIEDMPDSNGKKDGKLEIAIWKHDTGDAYITDVYRWNGTKLAPAKDVYNYYYKKVVEFYKARVKEMPEAAFYWYYLADAQIKVGNPKDALESIGKGINILKEHPDYYPGIEKFEELKKLLEAG